MKVSFSLQKDYYYLLNSDRHRQYNSYSFNDSSGQYSQCRSSYFRMFFFFL